MLLNMSTLRAAPIITRCTFSTTPILDGLRIRIKLARCLMLHVTRPQISSLAYVVNTTSSIIPMAIDTWIRRQ